MAERLHIEVWDRNRVTLNTCIGYASIKLIDIVQGSNI